jgi:hypothetical protein
MVVFYKQGLKEIPEFDQLDKELGGIVQFSHTVTRLEKVVIVTNIEDAKRINKEHPTAHLLLRVQNESDVSPREAIRLTDVGINDLYVQGNPEKRLQAISEALAGPKYFPYLHPNAQ